MSSTTSYSHVLELLHAAIPYVNTPSKAKMEIFIKVGELADSLAAPKQQELTACDLPSEPTDMEGLLQSLQSVSTPAEHELLNNLQNIVQTQKLYQTYLSMRDVLPSEEKGKFTRNQLLPLIENFFSNFQTNPKGDLQP